MTTCLFCGASGGPVGQNDVMLSFVLVLPL